VATWNQVDDGRLWGGDNREVRELPTGTITMFFSDIEGSTALLSRLGDRYGEALSVQRTVMRSAISDHRGHEMGTEGDSFFVVFESATDAVACCVAAQRDLARNEWPAGAAVRVRMGLHSGEPTRHEDGYIGLDVHRAARIAAVAHGSQVVLSDATRRLAESQFPADVSVRDLGLHRLKDIEALEHIYQLTASGLPEQFPPLKSLGAPTNLPASATQLVGREQELEQIGAIVARPSVRLVTLTGTGGVGKTRLALAAAASLEAAFPYGVFFVALAAVDDAGGMWKAIAADLNVSGEGAAAVTDHLRDRQALLVLDNLEQLDGAAGVVAALLDAAPRLLILVTSRRPLHLPGEHELPISPLETTRESVLEAVEACGAVQLFVQQATMVRPDFVITQDNAGAIAAICRRLDGLPLAIELAASRVKLLAPKALLARLDDSLGLAAAGVGRPTRQRTLRSTIAWSYDLLTNESADLLRRAGVFAGGFDLDALAAVAVPDDSQASGIDPLELLGELIDVSLITATEGVDGEPRLSMLETIREFALERLAEAGEVEETRSRHGAHYAALAEQARQQMFGPAQLLTLDRLEAEHDNLRAALSWSLGTQAAEPADGERAAIGMRLVQALFAFWHQHGHAAEGRRWLQVAIELVSDEGGAPLAGVAHGLGVLLTQQGEDETAISLFEQSLAIWRAAGDRGQQARELNSLGATHSQLGNLDLARSLLEDSAAIARDIGSNLRLAAALTNLGNVEAKAGNLARATAVLEEALTLDQQQGDLLGIALDKLALTAVNLRAGRARLACDVLSSTFDFVVNAGNTGFLTTSLELAACVSAELGDGPRAARLSGSADTLRQLAGMPRLETEAALLERFLAPARATVPRHEWDAELAVGRALTQQQAITLLLTLPQE
jgi:predicted ATPase/class 3 adenylate cyclase